MNFIVKPIKSTQCREWLLYKHYAKRMCSISYSFGLFGNKELLGIMTIGKPASNSLCIGVCGKENSKYVFELNRLCVNDNLPKNTLSFFVGQCLKVLPKMILVSYADTSMNHNGYIYQATNWIYTGLSAKRTEKYDIENPHKHSKTVTESKKNIKLGTRNRPQKHRYIYFIGNKAEKKYFRKCLNYEILPYPKGQNKRYDASYKPLTQTELF